QRLYSSWASKSKSTRRSCHDLEREIHFFENLFQIRCAFPDRAHFGAARLQVNRMRRVARPSRKGGRVASATRSRAIRARYETRFGLRSCLSRRLRIEHAKTQRRKVKDHES